MKRHISVALLALAVVPAVAVAAETDEYKGQGTDDKNVKVKFKVKKDEVIDFTAIDAKFKCDRELDNGKKKFRATPPSFSDMKIDNDEHFEGKYDVKQGIKGDEDKPKNKRTEIKFKADVNGKFTKKNRKKAKGDMSFEARYVAGPSQGARCDTETIDWKAERK